MKITIEDKPYELHKDELRKYDGFFYGGQILDRLPIDARIIGYVVEDKLKIAVCRKTYQKYYPLLYGLVGISGIAVLVFSILVIGFDVEVVSWLPTRNRDNVIGKLDDGTVKEDGGLKYSQYATYSNGNLSLYVEGKQKAEVSVTVDGVTSTYTPVAESYRIPITLELGKQEITQGSLNYKIGESINSYPLIVEHLDVEKPDLPKGNILDNKEARYQVEQSKPTDSMIAHPTEEEAVDNKQVATDFENFDIVTFKDINEPLDPQDEADKTRKKR